MKKHLLLICLVAAIYPLTTLADTTITFADPNVKAKCVENWDTNGDGELSEEEAAAVEDLGMVFYEDSRIISFDELRYFTGLTSIADYAFENCVNLSSIVFPSGITSIGRRAFRECNSMVTFDIPSSVNYMGANAFEGCNVLSSFVIPDGITTINQLFPGCYSMVSVTIPNSVTSISSYSFYYCSSLTSVIIPSGVTEIGYNAFGKCDNLTAVTVGNATPVAISSDVFSNRANATLYVPAGSKAAYQAANYWKEFKEIIEDEIITFADANVKALCIAKWDTNGDGELSQFEAMAVKDLGDTFCGNSTITTFNELQYFTGLASIGKGSKLSLAEIPFWAHINEWGLEAPKRNTVTPKWVIGKSTDIPYGDIAVNAFADLSEYAKLIVTFSEGSPRILFNRDIYEGQWNENESESHLIDNTRAGWSDRYFTTNGNMITVDLKQLVIDKGFAHLHAIKGANGKNVTITSIIVVAENSPTSGSDITANEAKGFSYCSSLSSITIPNNVTIIGDYAFMGCKGFASLNIPNSVTCIGDYAFYDCSGLTSEQIPNSVTIIGNNAFSGCSGITSITIPPTVSTIGNKAFFGCSGLTSVTSQIAKPFTIDDMCFNIDNSTWTSATLYVPTETKSLYKATDGWKKFKTIKTYGGVTITLKVTDDNNTDITNKVSIVWKDDSDKIIGRGQTLGGAEDGAVLYYSIELGEELGRVYREVKNKNIIADDETLTCQLEKIPTVTLTGQVMAYGTVLPRVKVNLTQWLNGKYEYEASTLTDANGKFSLDAYNDSTILIVTANGYVDNKTTCRYLNNGGALGDINMTEVQGKVVKLDISYQEPTREDVEPIIQNWYRDTRNIDYSVRNVTKGKDLDDYAIQQGNIVLPTGTDRGDKIQVIIRSLNEKFADVTAEGIIADNDTAIVTIRLMAFGGIEATYGQKADDQLLAMLYDNTGKLQMRTVCTTSRLTFSNLAAGSYSLVTMGYNGAIGSVADISDLANMDLVEGVDYVRSTATVRDGFIATVNVPSVPELDASKFEYTGINTYFTPNKTQLMIGNFITLSTRLDFKEQYADKIDRATIVIDIPDGCEFVPNSVVIGTKPLSHSLNGNKLKITVDKDNIDSRIRFCVIPKQSGKYITSALAEFDYKGMKAQSMGQLQFEGTVGEVYVPSTSKTKTITVGGIGVPKADVEVYDDDALIGTTKSLANGKWSLKCELSNAYNLSTHNIYVKYRGENNIVGQTEAKECFYDINAIVVNKVTMLNTAHPAGDLIPKVYETVFDFINQTTTPNYYSYWPNYPEFTFLVDFTDNDTTKVSNVTLYVYTTSGDVREISTEFDAKRKSFIAVGSFDSFSLPTNVGVNFMADTEHTLSRMALDKCVINIDSISNTTNENFFLLDALIDSMDVASEEVKEEIQNQIRSLLGISQPTEEDYKFIGITELFADVEKSLADSENLINDVEANGMLNILNLTIFQEFDLKQFEMDGKLSVKTCDGINFDSLIGEEYTSYPTDEGGYIYIFQNESVYKYIDPSKNILIEIDYNGNSNYTRVLSRALSDDPIGTMGQYVNDILQKALKVKTLVNLINVGIKKYVIEPQNRLLSRYNITIKCNFRQESALSKLAAETDDPKVYEKCMENIKKLGAKNKVLYRQQQILTGTLKVGLRIASSALSLYGFVDKMINCSKDINDYISLYSSVPDCSCMPSIKTSLQRRIAVTGIARGATYIGGMVADILAIKAALGGVAAAPATGGSSMSISLASITALLAKQIVYIGISVASDHLKECFSKEINSMARNSDCWNCLNPNPNTNPNSTLTHTPPPPGGGNGGTPKEDPSGYVYEAVPTNRIEGVKATIYYSDEETPVQWAAEEYGEVNPQITEEDGLYAWDVPQGMWKVLFEKDGYETAETEWLPVPPPQLEVNIPMSHAVAPYVTSAIGAESGISLAFSKYMKPNTLTKSNRVTVTVNGNKVNGDVEMLNLEENPYNNKEFASKIKFVPNIAFKTTDEVIITVKKEVESYADKQMDEDFVQRIKIESEITEIECDSVIAVNYQDTGVLEVSVLPAAAAKGKTMQVTSTSPMIASTDAQTVTLNDEGKARIVVSGELPGNASLHLSMPETGKEKYVAVSVVTNVEEVVKTPKASKLTGSSFENTYLLTLTCATKGATIYYTLDGSCPCNEQTRKKYTGPITLPEGQVTLQAIAVREGMADSDVATFNYVVTKDPTGIKVIEEIRDFEAAYQDNSVMVTGAKGASCHIYDMQGREIASRSHIGNQARISVPTTEVYVVSVTFDDGQTVVKKVMRK